MPNVTEILAMLGEQPGRLVTLPELLNLLRKAGFPTSRPTMHKLQMRGDGPTHFFYGNRAIYRLQDAIEWALNRTRRGGAGAQERVAA
jgi:hypothetical protein